VTIEDAEFDSVPAPGGVYVRPHLELQFPDVVSPMGWSLIGESIERSNRDVFGRQFGFFKDFEPDSAAWFVGRFGGRVYANLSTFRRAVGRSVGSSIQRLDVELAGPAASVVPPYEPSWRDRLWLARSLPLSGYTFLAARRRARAALRARQQRAWLHGQLMSGVPSNAALVERLGLLREEFASALGAHDVVRSLEVTLFDWFASAVVAAGGAPGLAQQRFADLNGLDATEPALAVEEAVTQSAAAPTAEEIVGVAELIGVRFAHRGRSEFDPTATSWGQDPAALAAAIQTAHAAPRSAGSELRRRHARREADTGIAERGAVRGALLARAGDAVETHLLLVQQTRSNVLTTTGRCARSSLCSESATATRAFPRTTF
jgi:hypothetical protein